MVRMLAGLLLVGAALLLGVVALLFALPRVETAGDTLMLLPGTGERHGLSVAALPVLGAAALALASLGALALGLGHSRATLGHRFRTRINGRSILRPALILVAGVALLTVVLLRH